MTLSSALQSDGIQLELLSGPLQGVYDPNGLVRWKGWMLRPARGTSVGVRP
ncbi:hypothetical protein MTF65_10620 [Streptomyces sp. APSN-46.1]|uniref:hypothetical protein n=1 Tax=Streptomyces sp. APSN-46.1 TaxID=2929049 RepID=UPI001FB31BE6|nr:hypothetical protein [Streptomyces sp. APSN-46.1]MCJ1677786.1 hypothetical protein [Streptomyces sp. APSN-46.1]